MLNRKIFIYVCILIVVSVPISAYIDTSGTQSISSVGPGGSINTSNQLQPTGVNTSTSSITCLGWFCWFPRQDSFIPATPSGAGGSNIHLTCGNPDLVKVWDGEKFICVDPNATPSVRTPEENNRLFLWWFIIWWFLLLLYRRRKKEKDAKKSSESKMVSSVYSSSDN